MRWGIDAKMTAFVVRNRLTGEAVMFEDLMRDTIEVLKENGDRSASIRASVQRDKITLMNPVKLVVDVGDLVIRKLSIGTEETYRVVNPEFHEGLHGIPPHYTLHVHKLGVPEAKRAVENVTYNISGHNTHINNNSVDQSTNISHSESEIARQLSELRAAVLESNISGQEKQEARELLDEVEIQLKSGRPKKSVIASLLKALPQVVSMTNAVASLINALHNGPHT